MNQFKAVNEVFERFDKDAIHETLSTLELNDIISDALIKILESLPYHTAVDQTIVGGPYIYQAIGKDKIDELIEYIRKKGA